MFLECEKFRNKGITIVNNCEIYLMLLLINIPVQEVEKVKNEITLEDQQFLILELLKHV